jgi:DNA-binding PadR family transcriptional regulator
MRVLPTPALHILLAVSDGEQHGYAIMQDIDARTDGALRLGPGTLYGTIKRLLADGLIEEVGERDDREGHDVRRRYYRITRRGRKVAADESARLVALVRHARAMGFTPKAV